MRDIEAAYKDALIEEHASYVRASRTAEAEQVAQVLRDRYDHDVDGESGEKSEKAESAPTERADAERLPEAAVDPRPRRTPRAKPSQGEDK
jgi:hypothetical protein